MKTIIPLILVSVVCALLLTHCIRSGAWASRESALIADKGHQRVTQLRGGRPIMSISDTVATTWSFLFTQNSRTPKSELPSRPVELAHFNHRGDNQLRATWLGHSSLMINIDGFRLLTDPVFEKRVSILGPTRFNGEVPLEIDQLPEIDAVIISHDHYDHLNKFSIRVLKDRARRFIVPIGVGARLEKWGVSDRKIIELDWWQEHRLSDGLMVAATPAQHFSGRGLTDRNQTLWASWVIESHHHRIFFSGDTGYFDGFKRIGAVYGPFDMTFIECGAYNPAWADVHLFPEQTVQAHLDLRGMLLHPIHWGTFNLSLHPWYDPMERLTAAAARWGVPTATPIVGDTTIIGESNRIPTAHWWRLAEQTTAETLIPLTTGTARATATVTANVTAAATRENPL